MNYIKEVFEVQTFDHAKHVVLTSDPDNPNKFKQETEFLVDKILEKDFIKPESKVLDFGCGMGRVSKEILNRVDCSIVGVDRSKSMRMFAMLYVSEPKKFLPLEEYTTPESIDVCLSILVLQHVQDPKKEIQNIYNVLKPGGIFILLNEKKRLVPADIDKNNFIVWKDDDINIFELVAFNNFKIIGKQKYLNSNSEIIFYTKL